MSETKTKEPKVKEALGGAEGGGKGEGSECGSWWRGRGSGCGDGGGGEGVRMGGGRGGVRIRGAGGVGPECGGRRGALFGDGEALHATRRHSGLRPCMMQKHR